MAKRHNHYEAAFEDYLRSRQIAYVAVNEQRRAVEAGGSLKSVDFIVSPERDDRAAPSRWLVDVKGRRFPSGRQYWRNWTTDEELDCLARWGERFGAGFHGVLQITGLDPGAVFVHRNIANVLVHTDMNALSVIEFSVKVLGVKHIIVCGHYGCGGVKAALGDQPIGLIDNWLRHIRDIRQKHLVELMKYDDPEKRINRLCELNVIEQVKNVCHTSIVQQAWRDGQELSVHGPDASPCSDAPSAWSHKPAPAA